jgi:chorismate mutase/prephenate dehydratase
MSTIEENRNQIDLIDDQIAKLFDERMKLVKNIAEEKSKSGSGLLVASREKSILSRVTKIVSPDIRILTKQLFNTVLDTSKPYQSRYVNFSSNISEKIKKVLAGERENFPTYATVACQGVEGAYSFLGAERLFELSDITYVKDFEGVFTAVEKGLCEYGILPIENSSVGSVNSVYDLMKKHKFYIVKGVKLPIKHCLLAKAGISIKDIKEVYSHDQALSQCSELIKELGVKVNVCENTAVAAAIVAESGRKDIASISSKECSELYGLTVLRGNVQDNDSNYTRFICISKDMKIFNGSNKISLMVNLPHEAGSLHKMLSKFTALGLNLTKLESRPMKKSSFEFMFYFDFEADIESVEVQNLIAELDNGTEQFTFLGSYSEI